MYLLIKRVLLLTILTYLKIAIILANSVHSTFLCICKVIADIFQLPTSDLLNGSTTEKNSSIRNISHCSCPKVSTFVQTEEESKQLENAGSKSSTGVIIYNLNSTQKLVITQGKFKSNQCENCKFSTEIATSEKVANVTAPSVGFDSSNISYMSIESDVVDSKIEGGCSTSSASSTENATLNAISDEFNSQVVYIEEDSEVTTVNGENDNYKRVSFENVDNTLLYSCDDKFNVSLDSEGLKENDPDNTYVKSDCKTANKQKTSSPLNRLFQNPQNFCTNLSMFNADQSRITENKDAGISTNPDSWGNNAFGVDFKRRFSLPAKLNTTNTAVTNFKLAQKKLIEDALSNTSRHEKSMKEIKYPFSSQISLDSKHNDEIEDKGVFSCSSYESLPVSDHLRNVFNNSALLSLYNESINREDKPDFSCIDDLVEAFDEIKSNLSLPNLAESKIIPSKVSRNEVLNEKGFESLNINVLAQSCSDVRMIKDRQKLPENLEDTKLVNDKNDKIKLCSDISLNSSVTDMCNVLNKFVTGEIKLVSQKFSDKGGLIDVKDELNSDVNFGNNQPSGMNDSERNHFSTKYKSFDKSIRIKGNQEENNSEHKLNEIKCTSSSPLKSVFSDLYEWTDDVENTILSLENKSETNKSDSCDNLQKVWQQSYHKIAFIDVNTPREESHKNRNISETDCQDHSLNKNEKDSLIEVDLGVETNKFLKYDNYGSFCKQQCKAFTDEIPLYELSHTKPNILETHCKEHQSTLFEENTSSGDSTSDNSVVTVKDLNVAGD